jgi:hypothetical protein
VLQVQGSSPKASPSIEVQLVLFGSGRSGLELENILSPTLPLGWVGLGLRLGLGGNFFSTVIKCSLVEKCYLRRSRPPLCHCPFFKT